MKNKKITKGQAYLILQEIVNRILPLTKPKNTNFPSGGYAPPQPPPPPADRVIREDGKGLVKPNSWKK